MGLNLENQTRSEKLLKVHFELACTGHSSDGHSQ